MDPFTERNYQRDPREYAYDLVQDGLVGCDTLLIACLKYLSHDDCREMLDMNEMSPRFLSDSDNEEANDDDDEEPTLTPED